MVEDSKKVKGVGAGIIQSTSFTAVGDLLSS